MKNRKLPGFILSFVLVALIAVTALTGCNGNNTPAPSSTITQSQSAGQPSSPETSQTPSAQNIGEGNAVFSFEVTDKDGIVTVWNVHTDEKTVGAALLAVGLIKGETSNYGLYVKEVNGMIADYDTDKSYWAFYVDGEYATAGVDVTDIKQGKTYSFVYTKE